MYQMRSVILLGFLLVGVSSQTNNYGVDSQFIQFPQDGINYPKCFAELLASDVNRDGVVKANEYLTFVQKYGVTICHPTDALTLEQRAAFNALACRCRNKPNYSQDCCLRNNAAIETAGAGSKKPTQAQLNDLIATCRVTDGTIHEPRGCDPEITQPGDPPPYTFGLPTDGMVGAAAPPPPPPSGLTPGQLAGIIIGAILAALLLLLCCFCCVWRRRKRLQEEEEQAVHKTTVMEDADDSPETAPTDGASPRSMDLDEPDLPVETAAALAPAPPTSPPPPPPTYVEEEDIESARGAANIDEEEEDEEIVKARGSAMIPPEDDVNRRRLRGEGEITDPENPADRVVLRPPPEKEVEENPDWDYPGRDINYPKDKDEMSAGEVEHYEPDGGVYMPERPTKEPGNWRKDWERPEVDDPDEHDNRKHRIQAGLGEGEVWDKLGEKDDDSTTKKNTGGDVFDWVVSSALGVLDTADIQNDKDNSSIHV